MRSEKNEILSSFVAIFLIISIFATNWVAIHNCYDRSINWGWIHKRSYTNLTKILFI